MKKKKGKRIVTSWVLTIAGAVTALGPMAVFLRLFFSMRRNRFAGAWLRLPHVMKPWLAVGLALLIAGLLLAKMEEKKNRNTLGWILLAAGALFAWKPASVIIRSVSRLGNARGAWAVFGANMQIRLLSGLGMVCVGLLLLLLGGATEEYWNTDKKDRLERIREKLRTVTDMDKLTQIAAQAPLGEVRQAAYGRRLELLLAPPTGEPDPEKIRAELGTVLRSHMYEENGKAFLASVAEKYPDLVWELWPKLEQWAHNDVHSHNDKPSGFHTDNTQYYDYIRYSNGVTVPNKSGRKRHTDARGSYSDCHDDRHQDSKTHTDSVDGGKLARFKPAVPQ